MTTPQVLVKVGGSLLDLEHLGPKLRRWLDEECPRETLLLAGGGACAEVIRSLDARHGLPPEVSHALAIKAMAINAALLAHLLPRSQLTSNREEMAVIWSEGLTAILHPSDQAWRSVHADPWIESSWDCTSDSLAAAAALGLRVKELILLKSVAGQPGQTPEAWAKAGLVDRCFPARAAMIPKLRWVHFRAR